MKPASLILLVIIVTVVVSSAVGILLAYLLIGLIW